MTWAIGSLPGDQLVMPSHRPSPAPRKHIPPGPAYARQPSGTAMRNPFGSRYHAQPAINASQPGWRLAGSKPVALTVGQMSLPRNGSAASAAADARGGSAPGRVPGSCAEATSTLTAPTSSAAATVATMTNHGRRIVRDRCCGGRGGRSGSPLDERVPGGRNGSPLDECGGRGGRNGSLFDERVRGARTTVGALPGSLGTTGPAGWSARDRRRWS